MTIPRTKLFIASICILAIYFYFHPWSGNMVSAIFKHRFGFRALHDFLFKSSMTTSFYGQEIQRALREQGALIQGFRVVNASPLQATARVRLLEGHSIDIILTQQGYKIDSKVNEGVTEIFEAVEELLRSTSPLYAQRRSEALFEALRRLS